MRTVRCNPERSRKNNRLHKLKPVMTIEFSVQTPVSKEIFVVLTF